MSSVWILAHLYIYMYIPFIFHIVDTIPGQFPSFLGLFPLFLLSFHSNPRDSRYRFKQKEDPIVTIKTHTNTYKNGQQVDFNWYRMYRSTISSLSV